MIQVLTRKASAFELLTYCQVRYCRSVCLIFDETCMEGCLLADNLLKLLGQALCLIAIAVPGLIWWLTQKNSPRHTPFSQRHTRAQERFLRRLESMEGKARDRHERSQSR